MRMTDLNARECANAGFVLALRHPTTNEPIDSTVTVLGADSDEYRNARVASQRALADIEKPSEDDYGREGTKMLAAVVVDWDGWTDERDNPIEFSREKALQFLGDSGYDWLARQIREAIDNRANFM